MRWIQAAILSAGLVVYAIPATAQYGDWGGYTETSRPTVPAARPTATATPTPLVPTPTPAATGTVRMVLHCNRRETGAETFSRGQLLLTAGETAQCEIRTFCTPDRAGDFTFTITSLNTEGVTVGPGTGSEPCGVPFPLEIRAGSSSGTYYVLFKLQHSRGSFPPVTRMVTVLVQSGAPRLLANGRFLSPVANPNDVEFLTRTRSWRAAISLRHLIYPDWTQHVAQELVSSSAWRKAVASTVAIDRGRIGISGEWPRRQGFRSYARLESIMSRYWADGGLTLSAATANEAGNVFIAWRRSPGLTVTLDEGIARATGAGGHVVKIGNVLNGVGFTMILLDFWNNATSAETPREAREAWYKAGYSSLDLYLANVVGDTFGASTALPGMFVSYILTNAYDTLIGGYKTCWFKKFIEIAVAEHWLGNGTDDEIAVQRVLNAMKSSRGLRGSLMDWWRSEAPTWAGKMGGCGNWDLAEARGYTEAFVDRLMRTRSVEAGGRTYFPLRFYWLVSRKLVREREREIAARTARRLTELEAAYLTELHRRRYRATLSVVSSDGSETPIAGARIRPVSWNRGGWTSGEDGTFTAQLAGDEFSPGNVVAVLVTTASGRWVFELDRSAFQEVTP